MNVETTQSLLPAKFRQHTLLLFYFPGSLFQKSVNFPRKLVVIKFFFFFYCPILINIFWYESIQLDKGLVLRFHNIKEYDLFVFFRSQEDHLIGLWRTSTPEQCLSFRIICLRSESDMTNVGPDDQRSHEEDVTRR